jgi:hypothetical protein
MLFDSWYAAWQNLKWVNSPKLTFCLCPLGYTTLKSNRLMSLTKEGGHIHLNEIDWTPERLHQGVVVRLNTHKGARKVPFKAMLFKRVATNGDIDWLIANELDDNPTVRVAKEANDVRWRVEQLHREIKQFLMGFRLCPCRKARSQRNHLACCYQAWVSLKAKAEALTPPLPNQEKFVLRLSKN